MSHLPTKSFHPYERRVDGDRITEMVPAHEWLNRPDTNKLKERADGPPVLPRHMPRDHLHDRNRELTVFDPADMGRTQYVRATRRRLPSPESEQQMRNQNYARQRDLELQEQRAAEEANELMELRSMGIKAMYDARRAGQMYGSQAVVVPPENRRMAELNKKLGVDKVKLVTSPLQIDTTPQTGHNTQGAAPGQLVAAPQNPVYAPKTTLRGNCWPTTEQYYERGKK